MKTFYHLKTVVVIATCVASFILIHDGSVAAQSGNPRLIGAARRTERMQRQNEKYERDRLERELANGPARATHRKNEADAIQAKQDFEKLQNNYNRIVLAMASKEGLKRDVVLADVVEIKKAATRLKTKLALPISADLEQNADNGAELGFTDSLLKLRQHIYDFLTNPLFDNPSAYKVDEAKKASADLDRVIKVSENMGKLGANK